jgi:hypothetical protein
MNAVYNSVRVYNFLYDGPILKKIYKLQFELHVGYISFTRPTMSPITR